MPTKLSIEQTGDSEASGLKLDRKQNAERQRLRDRHRRERRQAALNNPTVGPEAAGISPDEYSVLVGVSIATTYRLLRAGALKSIKLRGRRVIAFSEVKRLRGSE
jgi:excisionase family DNA binding protein